MTDLAAQPSLPAIVAERAAQYAANVASNNTARAYTSDLAHYAAWCSQRGLTAVPAAPKQVGAYLAAHAGSLSVATLQRRLVSISQAHRAAGHHLDTRHPAVADVMRGIKRTHGTAQRRVQAATRELLGQMVATCGDDLIGLRDRAVLLLGFGAALRRSEIVALEVADLSFEPDRVIVTIRRSKTDQDGAGQQIGVVGKSVVAALLAWLDTAGIRQDKVFRCLDRDRLGDRLSDRAVAVIIKSRAEAAGLDPAEFSGHSLRSGFATSAAALGVEERIIQRTTRHVDLATLRRYIRTGTVWTENASAVMGL